MTHPLSTWPDASANIDQFLNELIEAFAFQHAGLVEFDQPSQNPVTLLLNGGIRVLNQIAGRCGVEEGSGRSRRKVGNQDDQEIKHCMRNGWQAATGDSRLRQRAGQMRSDLLVSGSNFLQGSSSVAKLHVRSCFAD